MRRLVLLASSWLSRRLFRYYQHWQLLGLGDRRRRPGPERANEAQSETLASDVSDGSETLATSAVLRLRSAAMNRTLSLRSSDRGPQAQFGPSGGGGGRACVPGAERHFDLRIDLRVGHKSRRVVSRAAY